LYPGWKTSCLADPKADEHIESLRSLQARADMDRGRTNALGDSRSPHAWGARLWPKSVFPIVLRADIM
jgi:hypothetical protein